MYLVGYLTKHGATFSDPLIFDKVLVPVRVCPALFDNFLLIPPALPSPPFLPAAYLGRWHMVGAQRGCEITALPGSSVNYRSVHALEARQAALAFLI